MSMTFCLLGTSVWAQKETDRYVDLGTAVHRYASKLRDRTFVIFPVAREKPIQWLDSLKPAWVEDDFTVRPYSLRAQPGEYFVYQIGVWAIRQDLKNVSVSFSDLTNDDGLIISRKAITCFNEGGTDYRGAAFVKTIHISGGQVQALWMGVNLPVDARGDYHGQVTVTANGISETVALQLHVTGQVLTNHGFDQAKRLSRLAWLNSKEGINNEITRGYIPVKRQGNTLHILGRSFEIGDNGLPSKITSYFTASNQSISSHGENIISQPFHFIIEKSDGSIVRLNPGDIQYTSHTASCVGWRVVNTSPACDLVCEGRLEFDGFSDYHLTVRSKTLLRIKDIRLDVAVEKDKATYMMGLNKAGGLRPRDWQWKWDTTKNQDDIWLGAVNGGLRIKWEADNYVLPLVNVYYTFGRLHLPTSWSNAGKGGVNISTNKNDVSVNAYSGSRIMKKGDEQHFNFELLITPFKTIQKKNLFGNRFYQSGENEADDFIHQADSLGANIITVHQGNDIYPFINYPYSDVNISALAHFISEVHQAKKRAKVYYTTRELTINLPEFWPFVSLDGEIIYPGPGREARTVTDPRGPDPWLLENMRGRKYIPAWVSHFTQGKYAGMQDLSVITRPDSRLNNFYVAGLGWMVDHLKIDGIYIDDCSMDRTTICRVRKILDNSRPGANIDMHSWNHFNSEAGWASCMNLYMDLFPYIDRLWIGEGRNYNTPPDYWLVEISGIPFGLPGQMLQGGGNPWRGMVYGMTNRAGWTGAPPDPIWKFWDEFHIQDKEMIGYWDPSNPVTTDNDSIKVTVYKGRKETLLAVANFESADQSCSLHVDYEKLGCDSSKCTFFIPPVERYQDGQHLSSLDHLEIPGGKGYLIVVKSSGE